METELIAIDENISGDVPLSVLPAPPHLPPPGSVTPTVPEGRLDTNNEEHPYDIDTSRRYRDEPDSAREDEEEMRRANMDVHVMQKQMIDGKFSYCICPGPSCRLRGLILCQTPFLVRSSTGLKDQDDTLDRLSQAISRQRDLSLTISSELELHEGLIDETDDALDRFVALSASHSYVNRR